MDRLYTSKRKWKRIEPSCVWYNRDTIFFHRVNHSVCILLTPLCDSQNVHSRQVCVCVCVCVCTYGCELEHRAQQCSFCLLLSLWYSSSGVITGCLCCTGPKETVQPHSQGAWWRKLFLPWVWVCLPGESLEQWSWICQVSRQLTISCSEETYGVWGWWDSLLSVCVVQVE